MYDILSRIGGDIEALEAIGHARSYGSRMASVTVGDLEFHALSHMPVSVKRRESENLTLIIPLSGTFSVDVQGRHLTAQQRQTGVLLSGAERRLTSGIVSSIAVALHAPRLCDTINAMLGSELDDSALPDLSQDRELQLAAATFPLGTVIDHICGYLRQLSAHHLGQIGLNDHFYRSLALSLAPALSQHEKSGVVQGGRRRVDRVCEYILGHLDSPITLTDLERISGFSARGLQLAFQKRFNCTPMQWVRNARLDHVHRKLLSAQQGETVTSIMLACGLDLPNWYSTAYKARFGELPSSTLRRGKRG